MAINNNLLQTKEGGPQYKRGEKVEVHYPHGEILTHIIEDDGIPAVYDENTGSPKGTFCGWTHNTQDGYFFEIWIKPKNL